jgi:hypothetical protein
LKVHFSDLADLRVRLNLTAYGSPAASSRNRARTESQRCQQIATTAILWQVAKQGPPGGPQWSVRLGAPNACSQPSLAGQLLDGVGHGGLLLELRQFC